MLIKRITAIITCIMMLFSVFVPAFAAEKPWDGYVEKAGDEVIQLLNMNNIASIIDIGVGRPNKTYTKGHPYSLHWDLGKDTPSISFKNTPTDWSGFSTFEAWIYSEKAYGNYFFICLQCPSVNGEACYFRKTIQVDWVGWKRLSFPVANFDTYRTTDLHNITKVYFSADGWANIVDPECELYIGEVSVTKAGKSGNASSIWDGETRELANEVMKNSISLYSGSPNLLAADELTKISSKNESLTALDTSGVVMAPADFFTSHLKLKLNVNNEKYTIQSGSTKIIGTIDSCEAAINDKTITLKAAPFMKDNSLYLPVGDIASSVGYYAAEAKGHIVIGTDEASVSVIAANDNLRGLIAYKTSYRLIDKKEINSDDYKAARDKWVYTLIGDEAMDFADSDIIAKVADIDAKAQSAINTMNKAESAPELFGDKPYTSGALIAEAYDNLKNMALAYRIKGSKFYKDSALLADILYGLEYMYNHHFGEAEANGTTEHNLSDNWYYWQISMPMRIVDIMMLIYDDAMFTSKDAKKYLVAFDTLVSKPSGRGSEGSNLLESCEATIGAGILEEDTTRIQIGRDSMDMSFVYIEDKSVSNGEGFYKDGSYVYHGAHPYNTGYGLGGHMMALSRILSKLDGTEFELCTSLKENAIDWLWEGFEPLVFFGENTRATQSRQKYARANTLIKVCLYLMDIMDDTEKARVKAMIKNQVLSDSSVNTYEKNLDLVILPRFKELMADETILPREGYDLSKVYYNMDRVVHHRENFGVALSMSSSRTYNYESINDGLTDNRDGWYLSDGMVYVYNSADLLQYNADYWSFSDPYRRPGTTVDDKERKKIYVGYGNEYLSNQDFVGGVSLDDKYTTAAYALESYHSETGIGAPNVATAAQNPAHDSNLTGRKGYFLFDNEIVCLGNSINSTSGANVITVVDNRKSNNVASVTESVAEAIEVKEVTASGYEEGTTNTPDKMFDETITTRWAVLGDCWALMDLGEPKEIGYAFISFASGSIRQAIFDIELSVDGETWTTVFSGKASGTTDDPEAYDFGNRTARYVRFKGYGNTQSKWNSVTSFILYPPSADGKMEVPTVKFTGLEKVYVNDTLTELNESDKELIGAGYVHLEGTGGYYFPDGGNIKARKTAKPASFFELWFDNGKDPKNAEYAYVMLPTMDKDETASYAQNPDIEILTNTAKVQAVRDNKLNITGIIFWEAASFEGISVTKPMIVMIRKTDDTLKLSVSDPTHKLDKASITIPGNLQLTAADSRITTGTASSGTKLDIDFESSDGKSIEAEFIYVK